MSGELPASGPDHEFLRRLDPDLREEFERLLPVELTDPRAAREALALRIQALPAQHPPEGGVDRTRLAVPRSMSEGGPVDLTVYRPTAAAVGRRLPCLYWIHGGGHVMGSVEQDDAFLRATALAQDCAVVGVDWRHAPENPFPAALEDCRAGLEWTVSHAAELGIDGRRMVLAGASSGGGLAAGLTLLLRDRGGPALAFQVLIYPMLDDRAQPRSAYAIWDHRTWNRRSNLQAWRHYLGGEPGGPGVSPYAAPARAEDLSGLPPAFISVGELDLFRDENLAYAQRLLAAGVSTELHVYPGLPHGVMRLAPQASVVRRFARDRDDAISRALSLRPDTSP